MNLRDLEYFEKIAELENVGAAALVVHRTQPALTSCIRRLEEDCGARLLERSGRGVKLTDAGRTLLRWASHIRLVVGDAQREIAHVGKGLSGTVKIGIAPTAAHISLPSVIARLFEETPEIKVQATVGVVEALTAMLNAGDIDIMVATERQSSENLVTHPILDDQIVVVACKNHPVFDMPPDIRNLGNYRWVIEPEESPTRRWLEACFKKHMLPPLNVQLEINMPTMLPRLIGGTHLLGFISRRQLEAIEDRDAVREFRLASVTMSRRFAVSYIQDRYLGPAAERVIRVFSDLGSSSADVKSQPEREPGA